MDHILQGQVSKCLVQLADQEAVMSSRWPLPTEWRGWLIHFVKSWQPVTTWPNAREGEGCRENSRDLQRVPPSSLQLSPCKWRNYLRIWKESPGEGNGDPLQYSCLENAWSSGTSVLNKMESPWTEEPGALQFRGSQRVRHELATITHIPVGRIT